MVLTKYFLWFYRIYDSGENKEQITDLKKQLRDKESKLTDVKLEALSSQHQLDQLKEAMSKMKVGLLE